MKQKPSVTISYRAGKVTFDKDDVGLYAISGVIHKDANAEPRLTSLKQARRFVSKMLFTNRK